MRKYYLKYLLAFALFACLGAGVFFGVTMWQSSTRSLKRTASKLNQQQTRTWRIILKDNIIRDEYMGPDWFTYTYIHDYKHVTDSLERAIEIGREGLRNLTG